MKKAFVFVEGQTEQLFVLELLRNLRPTGMDLVILRERGGVVNQLWFQRSPSQPFHVTVMDCGGDGRVLPSMIGRIGLQADKGFTLQVGLRDVAPNDVTDIAKARKRLASHSDTRLRSVLCFAVMEIEAWFLGSIEHVERLKPPMSPDRAKEIVREWSDDIPLEQIGSPRKLLEKIYADQGHRYEKSERAIKEVVNALNWEQLYCDAARDLPHLQELINEFESFFENHQSSP